MEQKQAGNPRTYILIPGAWMGAWVWESVVRELSALGHQPISLTLSGLEHAHRDVSEIGLSTHVCEVAELVANSRLPNVVLVGHSYSGIVAGQVAARTPDILHTVFIEAFLPEQGRSMLDVSGLNAEQERRMIADNAGRWPAPTPDELLHEPFLPEVQREWLSSRFVGHPGRTVTEPADLQRPLSEISATYIGREKTAHRSFERWRYLQLDAGHWPMVTAPAELAKLLAEVPIPHAKPRL
jgi:pimeloyl-ACP methyl ester carboxylesterase